MESGIGAHAGARRGMKRKFAGKGGFAAELGRFGETTLPFIDRRCCAFDSSFVLLR